jgi:hypothetical protein
MADRSGNTGCYSFRFFCPEQIDQILRDGAKRGREGSHAAIERILKLEQGLERADLWQRIRQLKYPVSAKRTSHAAWTTDEDDLLRKGYAQGWSGKKEAVGELLRRHPDWRPHIVWKRAAHLGLVQRSLKRHQEHSQHAWSEHDDRILLNLAGYKEVAVIGKMLHRSTNAIRSRLSKLGKSSKVHKEGYAQRALSEELHFGTRTIRKLIAQGLLEVRDPRITRQSLNELSSSTSTRVANDLLEPKTADFQTFPVIANSVERPEILASNPDSTQTGPARSSRADRVWSETATQLGVSLQRIKNYVAQGKLKLYDPRITERSLRNLCRRYGALVNYNYLERETRDWLASSLDFARKGGEALARNLETRRKHARFVRNCACGREIRGNAFFRHVRTCRQSARSERPETPPLTEKRQVQSGLSVLNLPQKRHSP